ncbi:MAG: class IV adenylate cyclase [Acidobacteriota bacterium]|nr:class IV adenylate cyclase [Acidobacteriota bacterium]
MGIEIEKKYRLNSERQEQLRHRLTELGATKGGSEFEENTLYTGYGLDPQTRVLRLRRVEERAILTYKERFVSESAIRHQREDETAIENADALAAILDALGYTPALVYEKRRETWTFAGVEVVIDELPFGLYVEIEGDEDAIKGAEQLLKLSNVEAEHAAYPELTQRHGSKKGDLVEARFTK